MSDPIASPSYPCNSGPGGQYPTPNSCQYIVNVSVNRLGGHSACIYQVQDSPVDVSQLNVQTVAAGMISGTSVCALEPGSSQSMTLSVSEP